MSNQDMIEKLSKKLLEHVEKVMLEKGITAESLDRITKEHIQRKGTPHSMKSKK